MGRNFSGPFLQRFYDKRIKKLFGDKPLLGAVPFEEYLTKEFGKTPFLTAVFPYSFLSRKVKISLMELLGPQESENYLSKETTTYPPFVKPIHKLWMGRPPVLADRSAALSLVGISASIFGVLALAESIHWLGSWIDNVLSSSRTLSIDRDDLLEWILSSTVFFSLWFFVLEISRWVLEQDRAITYAARSRQYNRLMLRTLIIAFIFFLFGFTFGSSAPPVLMIFQEESVDPSDPSDLLNHAAIILISIASVALYIWQISRFAWTSIFKLSRPEIFYRAIACACLIVSFLISIRYAQ